MLSPRRRYNVVLALLTLLATTCTAEMDVSPPKLLPLRTTPDAKQPAGGDSCASAPGDGGSNSLMSTALHVVTVVTDTQHVNYRRVTQVASARGFNITTLSAEPNTVGLQFGFAPKLRLLSAFVAGIVSDTDVVLFVDGYGTLVQVASPKAFLGKYADALATYGAADGTVIIAAERNCFPDAHLASAYPRCKTFPKSQYKYLNSSVFAGSVAALRRLFAALDVENIPQSTDDQRAMTALYLKGGTGGELPLLVLDTGAQLFFCFAFGMHDAVAATSQYGAVMWRNAATNSTPAVLHGNGYTVDFLFGTVYPTLLNASHTGDAQQQIQQRQHVLIATPLYGGLAQAAYVRSILELVTLLRDSGIGVDWRYIAHESLITRARNALVHMLLRDCAQCTHLLFLDADIGFKAPDVLTMLRSGKDVIGGPYVKKGVNWQNVAAAAKAQPDEDPASLVNVMGHYVINFAEGTQTITLDAPVEVREIGTGLLLIARHVFHRLGAVYPERRYDPDSSGDGKKDASARVQEEEEEGPDGRTVWAFFDAGIDDRTGRYLSEDFYFCALWRAMGGTVWLCPWMKTTHSGVYDFPADLKEVGRRLGKLFQ